MFEVADQDLIAWLPVDTTHHEIEAIAGAVTKRDL